MNAADSPRKTSSVSPFLTLLNTIGRALLHAVLLPFLGITIFLEDLPSSIPIKLGYGRAFEPEKDIGDLKGKVILVTGGMFDCQARFRELCYDHAAKMNSRQYWIRCRDDFAAGEA